MENVGNDKISAIIVEDEKDALEELKTLLKEFNDISFVGEARDGISAINIINEVFPDLIFMDIKLPGCNGFEVLNKIDYNPMVIFTTGHDEYAIQAFEENSIDFIVKPVQKERLKKSIQKATNLNRRIIPALSEITDFISKQKNKIKYFSVKRNNEVIIIPIKDIFFFKFEDNYISIYTYDAYYLYDSSIKKLEKEFDQTIFSRISGNCIVSLDKIKKLKRNYLNPREYYAILKNKKSTSIKIGRHFLPSLKEKLNIK